MREQQALFCPGNVFKHFPICLSELLKMDDSVIWKSYVKDHVNVQMVVLVYGQEYFDQAACYEHTQSHITQQHLQAGWH